MRNGAGNEQLEYDPGAIPGCHRHRPYAGTNHYCAMIPQNGLYCWGGIEISGQTRAKLEPDYGQWNRRDGPTARFQRR